MVLNPTLRLLGAVIATLSPMAGFVAGTAWILVPDEPERSRSSIITIATDDQAKDALQWPLDDILAFRQVEAKALAGDEQAIRGNDRVAAKLAIFMFESSGGCGQTESIA